MTEDADKTTESKKPKAPRPKKAKSVEGKRQAIPMDDHYYQVLTSHLKSAQQGLTYLVTGLHLTLAETRDTLPKAFQERMDLLAQETAKIGKNRLTPPFDLASPEKLLDLIPGTQNKQMFQELAWGQQLTFAVQVAAHLPRGYYGRLVSAAGEDDPEAQADPGDRTTPYAQANFRLDPVIEKEVSVHFKSGRTFAVLILHNLEKLLQRVKRTADPDKTLIPTLTAAQMGYLPQNPRAYGAQMRNYLAQQRTIERAKGGGGQASASLKKLDRLDPVTLFLLEVAVSAESTEAGSKGIPTRFVTPRASERAMTEYLRFFPTETSGGSYALETFVWLLEGVLYQDLPGEFTVSEIKLILKAAQGGGGTAGPYAGECLPRTLSQILKSPGENLVKRVRNLPRMTRVALEILGQNIEYTKMSLDEWAELLGR